MQTETRSIVIRVRAAFMAGAVLILGAGWALRDPPEPEPFGDPVYMGQIENHELDEASGLAASSRRSDLLWMHNDHGARARLYAVGLDGRDLGAVDVPGASNIDWEDLAAFEIDDVPYLLIADVGDNRAERRSVMLYVVEEPELVGDRFGDGKTASVAWSLEVVSEDGPMDCEGVAVDVPGQRILLVSKRTVPLRLYEVPLLPSDSQARSALVATRVSEIANIPQPTTADRKEDPRFGQFRSRATALDVTRDGSELLLVTYGKAYRFERQAGEGWRAAVSRPPEPVAMPSLAQAEAGAYSRDQQSVFVTSEQRPAPLFRLDRAEPLR